MEDWEINFEWLRIKHLVKETFKRDSLPNMEAMLFLIGLQEVNLFKKAFSKEEKQDIMHVATCHLLSLRGYYEFVGHDSDGWPHYKQVKIMSISGVDSQEKLLKECIIDYFSEYQNTLSENES